MPRKTSPSDGFYDNTRHVTPRDKELLKLLAEHLVLSTSQIASLFYPSRRRAQARLRVLHQATVLSRHTWATDVGGVTDYLYSLGPLGVRIMPEAATDLDSVRRPLPRNHRDRMGRLVGSNKLDHTLGVNQFFVDLTVAARRAPGRQLHRWWSERHATAAYDRFGIHPDGHGVWQEAGRTVGFFLEHDNGTENHARVLSKFHAYTELAANGGPIYPVLLWVPSASRRDNLLERIGTIDIPVAAAVQGPDPSARIWHLAGYGGPYHLHELPSDHGPDSPVNPGRFRDTTA
ncbi:replication-relaxation family protein [Longispora albida]|uniref:replication-relaxation family protein n=1 Tax=Longispora albida TaxID=203523 RepID=UPI00037A4A0C|nr:replication-relaxation family protein [Longispora albida]